MQLCEMERVLSRKFQQKIKNLASPLIDHFGLSEFYHYRLSESGHFVNVGLNSDCEAFLFSDPINIAKTPYMRHPKFFKSGISFIKAIKDQEFEIIVDILQEQFNVHWSLQITTKTEDGIEAYGFGLNTNDLNRHFIFHRSLPLLRQYINRFKEELVPHKEFLEAQQVNVESLIGSKFYEVPVPVTPEPISLDPFLKELGLAPTSALTIKEIDVIKHLLDGCSASLIADSLYLSPRTVEHHIERIKDKFDCSTKTDLIKILRRLDTIGYFI